jgi:hypothetical protein
MSQSQHLTDIMERHQRTCNMQVVFVDIEKYSQRRTVSQIEVVDAFTDCLGKALHDISKEYLEYTQANGLNFQKDIIRLPTGDGVAVVFSFDGLHDIHLKFAKALLRHTHELKAANSCDKFQAQGWCNCHPTFNVKIGISEGKGIIFKDVNDLFNVAGGVVNMAARVMGFGERNHIMFTDEAFSQIVDMIDDPNMVDHFVTYADVEIKHKHKITIYQYKDADSQGLNNEPPTELVLKQRMNKIQEEWRSAGFGFPSVDMEKTDPKVMLDQVEAIGKVFKQNFLLPSHA